MTRTRVLSIAGFDPSGGAGVLSDVRVFEAFGCHGVAVVAGLTAQNSIGVRARWGAPGAFVGEQLDAVFEDGAPHAAKTGMLATVEAVRCVASAFEAHPRVALVVDPVVASSGGVPLADPDVWRETVHRLLPIASVVTPNAMEAAELSGSAVLDVAGAATSARRIVDLGARAVLVKGGHLPGDVVFDVLVERGGGLRVFERPRVVTDRRVRGTGCALSAAIAAGLGRGVRLADAVSVAGDWVHAAIRGAYATGSGALCLDRSVRVPGMPS